MEDRGTTTPVQKLSALFSRNKAGPGSGPMEGVARESRRESVGDTGAGGKGVRERTEADVVAVRSRLSLDLSLFNQHGGGGERERAELGRRRGGSPSDRAAAAEGRLGSDSTLGSEQVSGVLRARSHSSARGAKALSQFLSERADKTIYPIKVPDDNSERAVTILAGDRSETVTLDGASSSTHTPQSVCSDAGVGGAGAVAGAGGGASSWSERLLGEHGPRRASGSSISGPLTSIHGFGQWVTGSSSGASTR
ncbi:hypothetical protein T492DRAFT_526452 [Pavlovales sp. CCMP2436]|nr:hypothetical protein T492DRAFT_526452 [Pavlovales sp. CCMP2436]